MKHRHLEFPADTPVERWPSAAIVDVLDRGDLDAWRPLAAAIGRDPHGPLSERVLRLLDAYPSYGTSPLWRAWIERLRERATPDRAPDLPPSGPQPTGLAALRRRLGLTQAEVAGRMGISQSYLSKLERRKDVRLSSLRAYAEALGGRLEVAVATAGGRVEIGGDVDAPRGSTGHRSPVPSEAENGASRSIPRRRRRSR